MDYHSDSVSLVNSPDSFNIGTNNSMPARVYNSEMLRVHLATTPVPGLANGKGTLPRFRSELGLFIGVSGVLNASSVYGGFGMEQKSTGAIGGVEENVRIGFGLEGVLNEAGDGLVFVQIGLRQDGTSTNNIVDGEQSTSAGAITAAIPGRSGINLRMRLPFWLLSGDMIIAAPFLLIFSPKTLAKMAVVASNGGVIPWQSGIATRVGRFQFVFGREVGVSIYGTRTPNDVILIPNSTATIISFLEYQSTKLDFPILEYRPFRKFSADQSSSVIVQFATGIDMPHVTRVIVPENGVAPELKSVWYFGMRITFNWRHYFK